MTGLQIMLVGIIIVNFGTAILSYFEHLEENLYAQKKESTD
jgi:hypothetical protein